MMYRGAGVTCALPLLKLNPVGPVTTNTPAMFKSTPVVVTANSDYKLQLWRHDLDSTEQGHLPWMCAQTAAGPHFGGPVNRLSNLLMKTKALIIFRLALVPQQNGVSSVLCYSTLGKVAGLLRLPLDGNPANTMAVIAHSGPVLPSFGF